MSKPIKDTFTSFDPVLQREEFVAPDQADKPFNIFWEISPATRHGYKKYLPQNFFATDAS